jgi:DNA-binding MarR family transcriptional regulator
MTDIISVPARRLRAPAEPPAGAATAAGAARGAAAADAQLITCVELLFFAYRDFTGEADAVLAEFGLGRAHHRVLHFVNRNPGLKVQDLLDILKITKQSLARVLKLLVDQGWICQIAGNEDRRQRLLHTTEKGAGLAGRLDALQAKRIGNALAAAGPGSEAAMLRFLFAMIVPEERAFVEALLPRPIEAALPAAG